MMNPTSVIEMLLLGYVIAVVIQLLLGVGYTRLGRGLLIDAQDRWTPVYFGLTGIAWMISMAVATFFTLPLAEVDGRRLSGEVSLLLVVLLVLLVIRNRQQNPQQQSIFIVALFSVCILLGAIAGCLMRVRHPLSLNFFT
jgi:peptidoglycan biosynthesis protein MviN/MurJ (putative lipid II flippase)